MSEASEISRIWNAVLRRWPIVLAAAVIGAALMVAWQATRPQQSGYVTAAPVRISISGLTNMPTIDQLITYSMTPEAMKAVEESAGLDPSGVTISAAADTKDKQRVMITARAADADTSRSWAEAMGEEVRQYGLRQLAPLIELELARAARHRARIDEMEAEIRRTNALAEREKSPEAAAEYRVAAQNLEVAQAAVREALDVSTYALQGYEALVDAQPVGSPKKVSARGLLLSDVMRGGLVGLFIGALAVALFERRRYVTE